MPKTDKGYGDEKLQATGKGRKPNIGKPKPPAGPDDAAATLQPGFKVDESAAARALSEAYTMTRKRLHGEQ